MDISKKIQDVFNAQITEELYSANLYLEMAFWFRKNGWKGFANWMFKQADEEKSHALSMADFVINRGGEVHVGAIASVKTDFKDAKDVFVHIQKHEQAVTEKINQMADAADEEKDRASSNFINTFIDEQVEEEKSVRDVLNLFANWEGHTVGDIDKLLGARQ